MQSFQIFLVYVKVGMLAEWDKIDNVIALSTLRNHTNIYIGVGATTWKKYIFLSWFILKELYLLVFTGNIEIS